jgi:hypothetical protein
MQSNFSEKEFLESCYKYVIHNIGYVLICVAPVLKYIEPVLFKIHYQEGWNRKRTDQ